LQPTRLGLQGGLFHIQSLLFITASHIKMPIKRLSRIHQKSKKQLQGFRQFCNISLTFRYKQNMRTLNMPKASRILLSLQCVCLALLVTGCASEPAQPAAEKIVSGDQMLRDSQGIAQLGSRWQEGKQMVEQGQSLQRQGQAKIDEGRTLMEEGQKIMRESEENYKNIKH
jgi:hypothetical protein